MCVNGSIYDIALLLQDGYQTRYVGVGLSSSAFLSFWFARASSTH